MDGSLKFKAFQVYLHFIVLKEGYNLYGLLCSGGTLSEVYEAK